MSDNVKGKEEISAEPMKENWMQDRKRERPVSPTSDSVRLKEEEADHDNVDVDVEPQPSKLPRALSSSSSSSSSFNISPRVTKLIDRSNLEVTTLGPESQLFSCVSLPHSHDSFPSSTSSSTSASSIQTDNFPITYSPSPHFFSSLDHDDYAWLKYYPHQPNHFPEPNQFLSLPYLGLNANPKGITVEDFVSRLDHSQYIPFFLSQSRLALLRELFKQQLNFLVLLLSKS